MAEFQGGATPEAIARNYSTITLADAYATIAYALRHPREIEAYLAERERMAEEVREDRGGPRRPRGDSAPTPLPEDHLRPVDGSPPE